MLIDTKSVRYIVFCTEHDRFGTIHIRTVAHHYRQVDFAFALGIIPVERKLGHHDRLTHIVAVTYIVRELIAIKFGQGFHDWLGRELNLQGIKRATMQHQAVLAFFQILWNYGGTYCIEP